MWLVVELIMGPPRFTSHEKKNCKSDHGIGGPKRFIFRPMVSIVMVQRIFPWERQKRFFGCNYYGTTVEECRFDLFLLFILFFIAKHFHSHKERRGERVTHEENSLYYLFLDMYKKTQHIHFWCMGTSLGPRSTYTKDFENVNSNLTTEKCLWH